MNFEDPNLNISMPVFSIHGNHDDPSKKYSIYLLSITFMQPAFKLRYNRNGIAGFGAIGSMDLLSTSGLVNYFGKWTALSQVVIPPLILKKKFIAYCHLWFELHERSETVSITERVPGEVAGNVFTRYISKLVYFFNGIDVL